MWVMIVIRFQGHRTLLLKAFQEPSKDVSVTWLHGMMEAQEIGAFLPRSLCPSTQL